MNGLLGALTGAALAGAYAASLWLAVRRIAGWTASRAVIWLGLASLARMALVGVCFFALAGRGWEVALGGFVGFVMARAAIVARLGG